MAQLVPKSAEALDEFCEGLSEKQAEFLREVVQRVCENPSGQGNPGHPYTRKFKSPERYVGKKLPAGMNVWEFKPNQYRGLFVIKGELIAFLPVRGKRFMTIEECAWH